MEHFPTAVEIIETASLFPNNDGVCPNTTPAAIKILPTKFPRYTTTQFFNTPPSVTSFSSNGITSRLFPVNNSLPARRTMVSPPGNTQPARNLATDACSTDTEAAVEAIPPTAINAPARMANKNILLTGVFTLPFPVLI